MNEPVRLEQQFNWAPYRLVPVSKQLKVWLFRDKKCDKCDASFTKIEYLKYHKENAHSNIEFNCEATPEISEGEVLYGNSKIFE